MNVVEKMDRSKKTNGSRTVSLPPPPVYRPTQQSTTMQSKADPVDSATAPWKPGSAPPAYRPQSPPTPVQKPGVAVERGGVWQPGSAPPVYRAQSSPVAQNKPQTPAIGSRWQPGQAPAVYRPANGQAPQIELVQSLQRHSRQIQTAGMPAAMAATSSQRAGVAQPFPSRVVQRVRHRPAEGSTIEYSGAAWLVESSAEGNSNIKIKNKATKKTQNIDWQAADYWNTTPGDPKGGPNDTDRRRKADWQADDTDYNAAHVLADFDDAKTRAVARIKEILKEETGNKTPTNMKINNEVTLAAFTASVGFVDANPLFGAVNNVTQWELDWVENSYRSWKLVIDSDRPLADSIQEAHVGFTVTGKATVGDSGAKSTKFPDVKNIFGHIWLNAVPVSRQ